MSKVFCYSLDFHKKEKEFESMDLLLKEVVGAKEQANKALDNPELSYRGFRLVSADKISTILAEVISSRSEKIKKDYVDNITDLEKKIKTFEKSERKQEFKVDSLVQDHIEELNKLTTSFEKDKKELEKNHKEELDTYKKDFDANIKSMDETYKKDLDTLTKEKDSEKEDLIARFDKYSSDTRLEISKYNRNVSSIKDNYNLSLKEINSEHEKAIKELIENKNILITNINNRLFNLTETTNRLIKIVNTMVGLENKVFGKNTNEIKELYKRTKTDDYEYKEGIISSLEKTVEPISIEPLAYTVIFDKEENTIDKEIVKDKVFVDVPKIESKTVVEKPKNVEPIIKVVEKTVESTPKVLDYMLDKKIKVLTVSEYNSKDVVIKSVYLFDMVSLGAKIADLKLAYSHVEKDLTDDAIQTKILHRANENGALYSDIKDLVSEEIAKDKMKIIKLTRKEYNDFFGIKEVEPKEEINKIIEEDVPTNSNETVDFEWEQFKNKFVKTEYLKLMFSKDSISLKEASSSLTIPATQLKNMIGVLKQLGYEKVYNNDALLTPDELLLLIVAGGWLQNLSNMRKNNGESLKSLMTALYPSWKKYVDSKK